MALNDEKLIQDIISIQDEMISSENYEESKRIYAEKLMKAIKGYLMSSVIQISGTSNGGAFTGQGKIE